jgi:hypothetical protein
MVVAERRHNDQAHRADQAATHVILHSEGQHPKVARRGANTLSPRLTAAAVAGLIGG